MSATLIPRELTDSWQLTLEFWSEAARHSTLLGLAAKHKQLAWLAGKYRDASWSNPEDPIAKERLERVRRAAAIMFSMPTTAAPPPTSRGFRAISVLLIGAVIATGIGLVITEQRVEQHQRAQITRHP
jgi:hypothetical protein